MATLAEYKPKEVKEAFEKFITREIPLEADLVELRSDEVLVRVFMYQPPRKSGLIVSQDAAEDKRYGLRPYPVGQIIAVGGRLQEGGTFDGKPIVDGYKPGDFIRMRDAECGFVVNPAYEAWTKTYAGGNLQKVGEAPPEYMSNFGRMFSQAQYSINPFIDSKNGIVDTYLFSGVTIHGKIKDIRKFAKAMFANV